MNLTHLIEDVADRTGHTKSVSAEVVKATLDAIAYRVSKGEEVRLTNFGTFRLYKGRSGAVRNPRTGEKINRAVRIAKFRPSGKFHTIVRDGRVVKTVAKDPKGAAK